jgi:hypothetical protein
METEIMTGIRYCLGSLEGVPLGASDVTESDGRCLLDASTDHGTFFFSPCTVPSCPY